MTTINSYKFSEITIGLEHSFSIKVDERRMNQFLEITGDVNPLHIDEVYALSNGFSGRVVYGLLSASFYSTLVGVYLPGKYCVLHGLDVQFSKPVYIGDELLITGKVSYINESFRQVEIKASIHNHDGEKVSKAKIKVGVIDE